MEEQEEQDMDLVDMGLELELDLCLGQVTDRVEAMVQDQGLTLVVAERREIT